MSSHALAVNAQPTHSLLSPETVLEAAARLAPYIHRTPLAESSLLNDWLGHEIVFKMECQQKGGAFKIRGALNTLLVLKEQNRCPEKIVAFSSGNHAGAVAKIGSMFGIPTTIIMPSFVSKIKQQACTGYGAELILTQTRQEAEALAAHHEAQGAFLLHPYDNDLGIAGQGTVCLEALQDSANPDAIFAACGGGGLLAGTWLAKQLVAPQIKLYGCEPMLGNDATRSFRSGKIFAFDQTPMTIADGARTLSVTERTFAYLRQLDDFLEADDRDIIYWTQWLQHLLKTNIEPTSAVPMAAACQWLKVQSKKQRVLVILSGGNVDAATQRKIWEDNYLDIMPAL